MKAITKRGPFLMAAFILLQGLTAFSQDEEKTKVHLKVMNNDQVTVDTTFLVTSGSDSDELKKMIQDIAGIEDLDLHILSHGGLHAHTIKMKKSESDSVKTVAVFVGEDKQEIEIIQGKEGMVKVVREEDLKEVDEDEIGIYYVVKEKTDLDDVNEIVIKKKDGSVIIMNGDEIKEITDGHVYIKTSDGEKKSFGIMLQDEKDGTIVVNENVKVIKKEGEEGIEIVIMQNDTTKEKKEVKEKKAEKEKK